MAMAGRSAAQKILAKAGYPSLTSSAAPLSTSSNLNASDRPSRMGDAATLAAMKKGGGFRSSFSGNVATVFGATGCIARGVTNKLGKTGTQLIIPYHGEHYDSMRLKCCGDLGQVLFSPYNLKDEESIRTAVKHSNVVLNLTGREYQTRNFDFNEINVEGPARLARLAREAGADRFIHMSHVNARENPAKCFLPKGSNWLRTKWQGEQRVLEEFPDATIIRSTDVYGYGDSFLPYYFSAFRWAGWNLKSLPLWNRGEGIAKAPIHLTDATEAVFNAISHPGAKGVTYEIAGPEHYMLSDLIDYMASASDHDPKDYRYRRIYLQMAPSVFIKSIIGQMMPIGKMKIGNASLDKLERSHLTDDLLGLPGLADLGVTNPSKVMDKMPRELVNYNAFPDFTPKTKEEEVEVPDLVPLSRLELKEVKDSGPNPMLKAIGF